MTHESLEVQAQQTELSKPSNSQSPGIERGSEATDNFTVQNAGPTQPRFQEKSDAEVPESTYHQREAEIKHLKQSIVNGEQACAPLAAGGYEPADPDDRELHTARTRLGQLITSRHEGRASHQASTNQLSPAYERPDALNLKGMDKILSKEELNSLDAQSKFY